MTAPLQLPQRAERRAAGLLIVIPGIPVRPQTGASATGLTATPVTVIATDGNGCTVSQTYTLTEPSQLSATTQATDATCYHAPNEALR